MCMGSSPNYGADEARNLAAVQEINQQFEMANLKKAFSQFNDKYYETAAKAYVKANEPAFQTQARQTKDSLGFRLANQGLYNSSAGQKMGNLLSREITAQQQNLSNQGLDYANSLRRQIENYKLAVAQNIQAATNPTTAIQTGLQGMKAFTSSAMPANATNMFGNFAQQYLLSNLMSGSSGLSSGALMSSPAMGGGGALPATQSIVGGGR
jgi:hypothetical protein